MASPTLSCRSSRTKVGTGQSPVLVLQNARLSQTSRRVLPQRQAHSQILKSTNSFQGCWWLLRHQTVSDERHTAPCSACDRRLCPTSRGPRCVVGRVSPRLACAVHELDGSAVGEHERQRHGAAPPTS